MVSNFRRGMKNVKEFKLDLLHEYDVTVEEGLVRKYHIPSGQSYPSITSVLGANPDKKKFLDKWRKGVGQNEAKRISEVAARRGSYVHNNLESYVQGNEVECESPIYRQIQKEINKRLGVVRAIEIALYSHHIGIAGRADLIANFDGELSVIDYKTSRKPKKSEWIEDYFIQSTFYSLALEEMYGIKAKKIVIIIGVDDEPHAQVFIRNRRDYVEKLVCAKQIFNNEMEKVNE